MSGIALPENRPALEWVASLPADWVTPTERLLLLALALDSFDGHTCAPGRDALMRFCGIRHVRTFQRTRDSLASPTTERPALLSLDLVKGRHTRYRLQRDSESLSGDDSERLSGEPDMSARPDSESLSGGESANLSAQPVSTTCQHDLTANRCHTLPLPTLREGGREGEALTAPAPDGAALTRPSVAEVRDLVVSIVPAAAVGNGIDAGNEDLTDALATLLDNGWTVDMLRVTFADMPAPSKSATGQLLSRLKALATIDPSALVLPTAPAPTTSTADPLAEQDQERVRLFCKWSGADRQALSRALAELIGQGFALEYLLRAEHPDIAVYDPTMGIDAWYVSWTTNGSGDPEENYSDIHVALDGPTDCLTEQERQAWMAVTGDPRSFSPSGTRSTHERATVADFRRIVTGTHPIALGAYLRSGEPDSVPSTEPKPKGKPTHTPPDVADVLAHDTRTPGPKGFSMAQSPAHDGPGRPYRGPGFDQAARAADDIERQRQQAALQALAAGATAGNNPPEPPRCTRCGSTFGMADGFDLCANCRRDDYRRSTQQPKEGEA